MKKLFKPFVVTFDDDTILTIGRKTMAKAIDMMAWLCANQPDVTLNDGSFFRVSKTLRGNFAIDSFDQKGRFEERYIQRKAIAFVSQYIEEFNAFLGHKFKEDQQ